VTTKTSLRTAKELTRIVRTLEKEITYVQHLQLFESIGGATR